MKLNEIQKVEKIYGVASIRKFRETIINSIYRLDETNSPKILLVFFDPKLTDDRIKNEWEIAQRSFRKELIDRVIAVIYRDDQYLFLGKPYNELSNQLNALLLEKKKTDAIHIPQGGASYRLLKVLIYQHLAMGNPFFSIGWLSETAGCSYPTTANYLKGLGSLIEKGPNRQIRLRWVSKDEITQLIFSAKKYRPTFQYFDRSGKLQTPEAYIKRLIKLNVPGLALGGVSGARFYYPNLDLVSTPRLDISLHNSTNSVNLNFIKELDPALHLVSDPKQPKNVVLHLAREERSLFQPRKTGLNWADPVECLLDLYEIPLEAQANDFLDFLKSHRERVNG